MTNTDTTSPPDPTPTPTPVKPGYRTTEFYLSLAATLLTYLFASGALTNSTALAIAGMAASVLTALGYKVSRTVVKTAAVTALVALAVACTPAQRIAIAHVAWDCTAPERAEFVAAATPFADSAIRKATNPDGSLDATAIKAMFSKANVLTDAGLLIACLGVNVLAQVAHAESNASPVFLVAPPLKPDLAAFRSIFDEIRAEQFPGATFKTVHGEI